MDGKKTKTLLRLPLHSCQRIMALLIAAPLQTEKYKQDFSVVSHKVWFTTSKPTLIQLEKALNVAKRATVVCGGTCEWFS